MPDSPQDRSPIRPPHPLARLLIESLREHPGGRVLDFCAGSGRNGAALREAGHAVVVIDDAAAQHADPLPAALGQFAAIICTHDLLHGTVAAIAERLKSLADRLEENGVLYATFASARDARFGRGRRIGPSTFAPLDGDEQGVAHTYFTRPGLERLLKPRFAVEHLQECNVDAIAGSWSHQKQPLSNAVHWFVVARRVSMTSSNGLEALA